MTTRDSDNKVVYADYYTVIPNIHRYYYEMLEFWRTYYESLLNGKNNRKLARKIQTYIVILFDLLKNYSLVRESDMTLIFKDKEYKMNDAFNTLEVYTSKLTTMDYGSLKICKDAILNAHFALGLSNIEQQTTDEVDPEYSMIAARGL